MRKLVGLTLAALLVFSVVGTAFAENGTIQPFGKAKIQNGNGTINPLENGTIQPFESGTILPW